MLIFGGFLIQENFFFFLFHHPQDELISCCIQTIHRVTKILYLKLVLFFQNPYLDKRHRYHQRYGPVLFNACVKSFTYIYIYIYIYIYRQFNLKSENIFSSVTKNFLFERYNWNYLITDSLKPIHSIFCKSLVWSNMSNADYRSTRIIAVWNLLSNPLKIKSVSYTRQESVENFNENLINTYKVIHFYI